MADNLETTAAVEPTIAELREDLDRLRSDIAKLLETAGKTAKVGLKGAKADAETAAVEVTDWAEERYLALRECVREQPVTSCAIAAGIGFVLGQILLRR